MIVGTQETLRIAVVGLGIGSHHIEILLQHPRVRIEAICDADPERLNAVGTRFGIDRRFSEYERILESTSIDALVLAVPNHLHAEMSIAALEAGKHVLCEKPMAATLEDARRLQEFSATVEPILMINFSFRYHHLSRMLKEQIEAGVLGPIYYGRSVWHRRFGFPGFGGWFGTRSSSGGGPMIDLGVHRLDLALWLMDFPEPESINAATYNHLATEFAADQARSFDVEDFATGMIRFTNGATLAVEASWAANIREREFMETRLLGTRGGLVQRNLNGEYRFEAEIYAREKNNLITKHLDGTVYPVPPSLHEFVDTILDGRRPDASPEQGLVVQRILDGFYRSAESGRTVYFSEDRELRSV